MEQAAEDDFKKIISEMENQEFLVYSLIVFNKKETISDLHILGRMNEVYEKKFKLMQIRESLEKLGELDLIERQARTNRVVVWIKSKMDNLEKLMKEELGRRLD